MCDPIFYFIHLSTVPAREGPMDRQMEGIAVGNTRLAE